MERLRKAQIEKIRSQLSRFNISHQRIFEELLDHIATAIETSMQFGKDFNAAFTEAMAQMPDREIRDIKYQSQNIFNAAKKHKIRKLIFGSCTAMICMLLTVVVTADETPDIRPFLNTENLVTQEYDQNVKGYWYEISENLDICATADGVVEKILPSRLENKTIYSIIIRHGHNYQSLYINLQNVAISVGERVKKNEQIGTVYPVEDNQTAIFIYKILQAGKPVVSKAYF